MTNYYRITDTGSPPALQTFTPDRKAILTIHRDGRIEVGEDGKPTEMAEKVLEAMERMLQLMLAKEYERGFNDGKNHEQTKT